MAGGPAGADDANDIVSDLGVHDVEETLSARITNKDETDLVQAVGIVRAKFVLERGRGLRERDTVLPEIGGSFPRVPCEPHSKYCTTIKSAGLRCTSA